MGEVLGCVGKVLDAKGAKINGRNRIKSKRGVEQKK
jgi:hypothetical protein